MNVAIVGSGSIAGEHALAIASLRQAPEWRDLRLVAVVGRDQDAAAAFAREHGIPQATAEFEEVLSNPSIEAVVVTSPTDLHAGQTERALRAGKHVLCEIPLATSLAETDRLIALADAVDRRLMVCHTQRFYPALMEARRRVERGEMHPHAIVSRYFFDRRENVNWKGRRRSWTDNLLWHHGCHAVDAALWLLGAGQVDTVAQIADPDPRLGIPMNLSLVMRTPANQIATVAMSYHAKMPLHDYLIIGEETTLLFRDNELRSPDGLLVPSTGLDPLPDALPRQNAAFFAAVRDGRDPPVSARAVRPAMAALQAAQDGLDARLANRD